MPLAYVLLSAPGWVLQPARSACILSTHQSLPWVHRLLYTWCWLSGEISGNISGQQRGIRGIIYNIRMRTSFFTIFLVSAIGLASCNKEKNDSINIEGFILTDALGNQIGIIGSAGDDWKILDWSQLSAREHSFLNFPDNIDMSNTTVCSLNQPVAYPNPFSDITAINFHSADSVKVKLAVVNSSGKTMVTFAMKTKGYKFIALNFTDNNLYPPGTKLRYYFSYSAATQQNFKCGYGDVKVCKPLQFPVSNCF